MSEIHILNCKPIVHKVKGEKVFNVAGVSKGVIYLVPIPKYGFKFIERRIEFIIEHESTHLAICKVAGIETSICYDDVFPQVLDLENFRKKSNRKV